MTGVWLGVQIVFLFGLAILVHEFGHFVVARWFGIKVHKFSIGFGRRLVGFTRGDTEYVLSAIPLGGYVRLAGEEWLETGKIRPYDLMAKPWWARILVFSAGVVMNALLAFVLFFIVLLKGLPYGVSSTVLSEVPKGSAAAAAGIRSGDRVVAVDGQPVNDWEDVIRALGKHQQGEAVELKLAQDGEVRLVRIALIEGKELGLQPVIPAVIGETMLMHPARKAGLRKGDTILAINGEPVTEWSDVARLIGSVKQEPISLKIRRGEREFAMTVTPKFDRRMNKSVIGISPEASFTRVMTFSVPEAARNAAMEVGLLSVEIVKSVGMMISGKVNLRDEVGGPVLIARIGYEKAKQGIWDLLHFIGVLNISLMVLNLLPIPVLDGGMILMALWEGVSRRRVSARVYATLTQAGMVFLLGFILYVTFNDVMRFFR